MNNLTATISRAGASRSELTQLAMSGAYSGETINNILDHFDEIDTNKDGRVTSEEISAFTYSANKQEMMDEQNHKMATQTSLFYSDDSSSELSSYSILSYRYKNFNGSK